MHVPCLTSKLSAIKFIWYGIQNESRSIQSIYLISPEDKQVKKHLAKEIHSRQEKGQLNFQVKKEKNCVHYLDHRFTIRKLSLSLNCKLISSSTVLRYLPHIFYFGKYFRNDCIVGYFQGILQCTCTVQFRLRESHWLSNSTHYK